MPAFWLMRWNPEGTKCLVWRFHPVSWEGTKCLTGRYEVSQGKVPSVQGTKCPKTLRTFRRYEVSRVRSGKGTKCPDTETACVVCVCTLISSNSIQSTKNFNNPIPKPTKRAHPSLSKSYIPFIKSANLANSWIENFIRLLHFCCFGVFRRIRRMQHVWCFYCTHHCIMGREAGYSFTAHAPNCLSISMVICYQTAVLNTVSGTRQTFNDCFLNFPKLSKNGELKVPDCAYISLERRVKSQFEP